MDLEMTLENKKSKKIKVADDVFNFEYKPTLVHQIVTAFLANKRIDCAVQKNESQVRGGGAKPWNQKGSGRARAGTIRSPIWRSGGSTFGANKRNYEQKVNRKMYKSAMRSILSELIRQDRLKIVEHLQLVEAKTKLLKQRLNDFGFQDALIVTDEKDDMLSLASRNLPNINLSTSAKLNPYQLLVNKAVVITQAGLTKLEERLA